jgi:precorrin-3B synthase
VRSVWDAADGGLARIRIPGGRLTVDDLRVLADAAADLGSGVLELTSRANVQVRGLRPAGEHELAARLRTAGLMPSETHDRVRNIVASPLTGLLGRDPDVGPLVVALDDGLCADPDLATLPGRFLFALDDGSRDVGGLDADVTLMAVADGYVVRLGGVKIGLASDPVAVALSAARGFLAERGDQCSPAWRIAELANGPARVAARIDDALMHERTVEIGAGSGPKSTPCSCMSTEPVGPGTYEQADGRVALVLDAGEGRVAAAAFRALAEVADPAAGVRITPWRGVVLPNLDPDAVGTVTAALAPHGLRAKPGGAEPEAAVTERQA